MDVLRRIPAVVTGLAMAAVFAVSPLETSVAHASTAQTGYWVVAADGSAKATGTATQFPGMTTMTLNKPIVNAAASADAHTLWMLGGDGGVFSFCNAASYTGGCASRFFGSTGNIVLNKPAVGIESTSTGNGYWFVASDGGVFSYGDAHFYGSMGGQHLNSPIIGMRRTATGHGYWLIAADGGVFSFGDATFYGSLGGTTLTTSIVGIEATQTGNGYWLTSADGNVFLYGDAVNHYYGSLASHKLSAPVVGMAGTSTKGGYVLAQSDGNVTPFGDAIVTPALGGFTTATAPIVSVVGLP